MKSGKKKKKRVALYGPTKGMCPELKSVINLTLDTQGLISLKKGALDLAT